MAGQNGENAAIDRHARLLGESRFSPDGQRLVLLQQDGDDKGVFVYAFEREAMSRLTFGTERPVSPVWNPDGKHIVFSFILGGLGWIRADGAGETERMLVSTRCPVVSACRA